MTSIYLSHNNGLIYIMYWFIDYWKLIQVMPTPGHLCRDAQERKLKNRLHYGNVVWRDCVACCWDGIRPSHQIHHISLLSMWPEWTLLSFEYRNPVMGQLLLNSKVCHWCQCCDITLNVFFWLVSFFDNNNKKEKIKENTNNDNNNKKKMGKTRQWL